MKDKQEWPAWVWACKSVKLKLIGIYCQY